MVKFMPIFKINNQKLQPKSEHQTKMKIEIDQSGKIENTSRHTFVAFSNDEHFVLKINSREKRKLQKYFRSIGKSRLFIYITFATLIVILLKHFKSETKQITIDVEYPGKSNLIRDLIENLSPGLSGDISFHRIGKNSPAHYLAHGVAIKKSKPDLIIDANQLLKLIKKSGSA